jgi:hypothetical protein
MLFQASAFIQRSPIPGFAFALCRLGWAVIVSEQNISLVPHFSDCFFDFLFFDYLVFV